MKHKNQISLWRSNIIQTIKWTSMCFVCLMTFSLGIFLGKKWSDADLQSTNRASLELGPKKNKEIQPHQEQVQVQNTPSEKPSSQKLHSQKSVTTTTNPSQREPSSDTEEVQKDQSTTTTTTTKKDKLDPSTALQTESSSYNNLPSKVTETISAKYTIQLGTYKQEKQAISYLKGLQDQGIDAFYMSFTNDSDQTWYRVSSGVYLDEALANNDLQRILKTTSIEEASVKEIF